MNGQNRARCKFQAEMKENKRPSQRDAIQLIKDMQAEILLVGHGLII